jgi:hypothetical protein
MQLGLSSVIVGRASPMALIALANLLSLSLLKIRPEGRWGKGQSGASAKRKTAPEQVLRPLINAPLRYAA